jgi:hypothetical protein
LLDVSDEVRAEIGDDEADRLLGGSHTPDTYDCTSCRTPGNSLGERTSTVLFVGEETAVLAFAHARCIPSQVVPVSEAQLAGAVRSISQTQAAPPHPADPLGPPPVDPFAGHLANPMSDSLSGLHTPSFTDPLTSPLIDPLATAPYPTPLPTPMPAPRPTPMPTPMGAPMSAPVPAQAAPPAQALPHVPAPAPQPPARGTRVPAPGEPAVLGVTCGLVLCGDTGHAALVVEPTGPVGRPGRTSGADEFLPLLLGNGFAQVADMSRPPERLVGWSVLFAMGRLHSILQPSATGTSAWWQAHSPLVVTEAWRNAANSQSSVIMYAAPAGTIGRQPREDLLRSALDRAAARGLLLGATLPLAGT